MGEFGAKRQPDTSAYSQGRLMWLEGLMRNEALTFPYQFWGNNTSRVDHVAALMRSLPMEITMRGSPREKGQLGLAPGWLNRWLASEALPSSFYKKKLKKKWPQKKSIQDFGWGWGGGRDMAHYSHAWVDQGFLAW